MSSEFTFPPLAALSPLPLHQEVSDIAIRVRNLSKCYQIYGTPRDRLKQFVVPGLQRMIGRTPHQYFREFWALKDISFEIKKGETVGIIGRNGSGKSTLLQIICGTLTPTSGSVETRGRIAALLELGSGFNPEFTGRENVYMNGSILGLSQAEIDARFDDIVAFADIGQFIEQPVKTYSSGMYVRLAFAVNILSEPNIMIVDEALAVGDMAFQAKCMTALARIQERGATVIFVSHDIDALKSLCSRGVYLERGVLHKIGPAGEVAEHYIRKVRGDMNIENAPESQVMVKKKLATIALPRQLGKDEQGFKMSADFESRVEHFRYGEGGARITYAELLDEDCQPVSAVEFNQHVSVRVYFEAATENEISCNYYVMDDKKNLILGADLLLVGEPLIHAENGGRYVVTYKTRLPLLEGNYSVQLQLTTPVLLGQSARFLDVIEDAFVFKMSRREIARIWTKAFVDNQVTVKSC